MRVFDVLSQSSGRLVRSDSFVFTQSPPNNQLFSSTVLKTKQKGRLKQTQEEDLNKETGKRLKHAKRCKPAGSCRAHQFTANKTKNVFTIPFIPCQLCSSFSWKRKVQLTCRNCALTSVACKKCTNQISTAAATMPLAASPSSTSAVTSRYRSCLFEAMIKFGDPDDESLPDSLARLSTALSVETGVVAERGNLASMTTDMDSAERVLDQQFAFLKEFF